MDLMYNLDPTSWSRNWDEEEVADGDVKGAPTPTFQWAEGYGADGKIRAKALVVAVKSAGAVFVRASIDLGKLTKVAQVYFSDMKKIFPIDRTSTLNDKVCELYLDQGADTIYVVNQLAISAEQANDFAATLLAHVQAHDVIVLDTMIDWKYTESTRMSYSAPLLRKVETDASRTNDIAFTNTQFLESPHLIDGVAAAIISKRQIRKLRATLLVSLESSRLLEVETVTAYEAALSSGPAATTASHAALHPTPQNCKALLQSLRSRQPNPLFL